MRRLVLAIVGLVLLALGAAFTTAPQSSSPPAAGAATQPDQGSKAAQALRDREVKATIERIRSDGPFRHRQDGITFQNRENKLPRKPAGYYREYTVETPGSPDRGPRRIVTGREGEMYFTADHYRSFIRIDGAPDP